MQVADKLACLSKASTENKAFFDAHTSSIEGVTNNAKRKWDDFAQHANKSSVDGADFVSFKHCRIEQEFENWLLLLQLFCLYLNARLLSSGLTHLNYSIIIFCTA